MMSARATILIGLLLAPCLLPAQSLKIVSISDAGAVGESDSGADSVFVEQARPASVSDDGSVVFVSFNAFDAINDDNDLFDVYRRSIDTTAVVSAYHDLFNPLMAVGHAETARFDNSQNTGIILRQDEPGYLHTTLRKVFLIDGSANEIELAPPALNVNLPVMSADGNALAFTANGDAVGDGGTGNGVFAAVRDTGWELVRISALTGGDAATGDTMTLYDQSIFLDQPTDRYGTPSISNSESHGLQVAFTSTATNLPDASDGNIYVYLRQHGTTSNTVRISNRHAGGEAPDPGPCHSPAISDDGNYAPATSMSICGSMGRPRARCVSAIVMPPLPRPPIRGHVIHRRSVMTATTSPSSPPTRLSPLISKVTLRATFICSRATGYL